MSTNYFKLSDDEIFQIINGTGFRLYGNYKKEEKSKLINLFKDTNTDLLGITVNKCTGNRVLSIRFWNSDCKTNSDTAYRIFYYEY